MVVGSDRLDEMVRPLVTTGRAGSTRSMIWGLAGALAGLGATGDVEPTVPVAAVVAVVAVASSRSLAGSERSGDPEPAHEESSTTPRMRHRAARLARTTRTRSGSFADEGAGDEVLEPRDLRAPAGIEGRLALLGLLHAVRMFRIRAFRPW